MPFEKEPLSEGCGKMGFRTLLLAAFLLSVALLFAWIGVLLLSRDGGGMLADMMESEAVHAFLGIGTDA